MKKSQVFNKQMNMAKIVFLLGLIGLVLAFTLGMTGSGDVLAASQAASAPGLGAAESFSALAALAASSANPNTTTLGGDLGLYPGEESSRTGLWNVGGSEYFGPGTVAQTAQGSALGAFNNLAGQGSNGTWSLDPNPVPGVWTSDSSSTFTGTLTLEGDYDSVWVFQIPASLTFSGSVVMAGNAQPCNVFWQVGVSATIASGSSFIGTLIASQDITVVSGAYVAGRVIALNGALTTDNNTITMPPCVSAPLETTPTPTVPVTTPLPNATATPSSLLPTTGVDLVEEQALATRQWIRFGLVGLSFGLLGFGLFLREKIAK